jgi:D-alanyl-D-alanine dipeptidase
MSPVNKTSSPSSRFLLFCVCALIAPAPLHAQTAAAAANSLLPGPKPPDVSMEWKQLVGIYNHDKDTVIILERIGSLVWQASVDDGSHITQTNEIPISVDSLGGFGLERSGLSDLVLSSRKGKTGSVTAIILDERTFTRTDAGADPTHFYHITPSEPIDALRKAALAAKPPQESGPFREPELVELATLDPAFHLDIRYAQTNNFLSTPLYTQARAFLQRPAAEALLRVLHKLQPLGYGLLIHDAYRPWYVTKIFWDATPPEDHNFVADPQKGSRHNRGCAVDLTLYDLATGHAIEMPGLYDEMSARSFPTFPGGTSLQRWHRDLLRRAMESEGFTVNEDEWWHFDHKDWTHYPILNVPFENLSAASPRP